MPAKHPLTGRTISTVGASRYEYNPACRCDICANNGNIPQGHPETGHSFCYGLEHIPPFSRAPWRQAA